MVKPDTVILLRPDSAKAFSPPRILTPGLALNAMGLAAVPDASGLTEVPGYVPERTSTVSPASASLAAAAIEQNGSAAVPGPASEHPEEVLSTVRVVAAYAGVAARVLAVTMTAVTMAMAHAPAAATPRLAGFIARSEWSDPVGQVRGAGFRSRTRPGSIRATMLLPGAGRMT